MESCNKSTVIYTVQLQTGMWDRIFFYECKNLWHLHSCALFWSGAVRLELPFCLHLRCSLKRFRQSVMRLVGLPHPHALLVHHQQDALMKEMSSHQNIRLTHWCQSAKQVVRCTFWNVKQERCLQDHFPFGKCRKSFSINQHVGTDAAFFRVVYILVKPI